MKISIRVRLICLGMAVLAQLACQAGLLISDIQRFNCESSDGIWRQEVDANGEVEEWCDRITSPTSTAAPTPIPTKTGSIGACLVTQDTFTWSYEDVSQVGGTAGKICRARFVFTNTSAEPWVLLVYTAWNNNQIDIRKWERHPLSPGEAWEENLNWTFYKDGTITYATIGRLLVVRDTPDCASLLVDGKEPTWDSLSSDVEPFPCP